MNLEMKDAVALFKSWRDSSAVLLVTLGEDGKTIGKRCRIVSVCEREIVVSLLGEVHTFTVRRLDEADFLLDEAPNFVLEVFWANDESCRFEFFTN